MGPREAGRRMLDQGLWRDLAGSAEARCELRRVAEVAAQHLERLAELERSPGERGSGPRFRHVDEEEWREVRAQMHAGRRASVREKWLEFTPERLCLVARWDPGMIVRRHGHRSDHLVFVLAGEMLCGDVRCTPGMLIALDQGAAFGPFVAGPEGVELFEVMLGDPRSWPADPEGFERLLAERGVTPLPHPPIKLPPWLEPDA